VPLESRVPWRALFRDIRRRGALGDRAALSDVACVCRSLSFGHSFFLFLCDFIHLLGTGPGRRAKDGLLTCRQRADCGRGKNGCKVRRHSLDT